MTERGRRRTVRTPETLAVGRSAMHWVGDALVVSVDELTAPLPVRLRGVVRVTPEIVLDRPFNLDENGRHVWRPIAPRARIEVDFSAPALRWRGDGYLDSNAGDEPLERGFRAWTWARAHHGEDVTLLYDAERRNGSRCGLALHLDRTGKMEEFAAPPMAPLRRTGWGLARAAWQADGATPALRRTLEDTPFYARTALDGTVRGARAAIMHEALSLDRLRSPVVRAMLPFRMPRIVW